MRFQHVFVRAVAPVEVPAADVTALAELLVEQPAEVLLTGRGVKRGDEPLRLARLSAALARRNVRSLLAVNTTLPQVAEALEKALSEGPDDAEAALADGGLEFNLRYSVFATGDASLRLDGRELVISDGRTASLRITRTEIREHGGAYFCADALARLASLPIQAVRFSPTAILPVPLQREPGAVMEPDTAQQRLHKGDWRSTRQLHFAKEFCITCSKCFIHCPDNAIIHAMYDKAQRDATGILGIDLDRCTACGICVSVCPTDRNGYRALVMVDIHADGAREDHHVG